MRTRLAVMALIISVTALSGISGAATYTAMLWGLGGEYGSPTLGDLNHDGYINVGDLQLFVASLTKQSRIDLHMGLQSISEVRLYLGGTLVDYSGGVPAYFSVDNGAFSCPPVSGAFDQVFVLPGYSTSLNLLSGEDTITLSLVDDPQFYVYVDKPAEFRCAYGTITKAYLEIDAVRWGDINDDRYVNVGDLQSLVAAWGSILHDPAYNNEPSPNWNPRADLNDDGAVNIGDLQVLIGLWGPGPDIY